MLLETRALEIPAKIGNSSISVNFSRPSPLGSLGTQICGSDPGACLTKMLVPACNYTETAWTGSFDLAKPVLPASPPVHPQHLLPALPGSRAKLSCPPLSGAACRQKPLLFLMASSAEASFTLSRCSPAWNSRDCPVYMGRGTSPEDVLVNESTVHRTWTDAAASFHRSHQRGRK